MVLLVLIETYESTPTVLSNIGTRELFPFNTYKVLDLYITALSNRRTPNGPVKSRLIT